MSEFASDASLREALRAPFPAEQIGTLPRGGVSLSYVGHAAVTDRLNRVAPGWSYSIDRIVETDISGLPHVLAVIGTVTIGGIARSEVGDVDRPSHYGDELKKAISDLIRRGAMRFGVAIDLWSKEDLMVSSAAPTPTPAADDQPAGAAPSRAAGAARSRAPRRPAATPGQAGDGGVTPLAAVPAPGDPDAPSPTQHFPVWADSPRARGMVVCAFPGCLIHPARRGDGGGDA